MLKYLITEAVADSIEKASSAETLINGLTREAAISNVAYALVDIVRNNA